MDRICTVDSVILIDGKIVLVKRKYNPYKSFWALPGGHMDTDETGEEAAARELKEETNLDVVKIKMLGFYSDPKRDPKQKVTVSYAVEATGEMKAGDDAEEVALFDTNNLPENIGFDHRLIIEDFLKS